MSNEESQKRMDFIIEQQAQFSADIQQLKEAQMRTQAQIDGLKETIDGLTETQVMAEARASRMEDAIVSLVNVAERLADAQAQTDERLNVFIGVVERYISQGRNGQS